ncbi:PD40 domain-containing protein [bacterium]|nr:PD40 domain-containing protein [bacterium]
MNKNVFFLFFGCILLQSCANSDKARFDPFALPPGDHPQFFAEGKICTRHHEHSAPSISPNGDAIYWSAFLAPLQSDAPPVILFTEKVNGHWTNPEVASFSGQFRDNGPVFTPDGKQIYFYSNRPKVPGDSTGDWDIWIVDKSDVGWSEPYNLGEPINGPGFQGHHSFANDGTLYFLATAEGYFRDVAVCRSRKVNGQYQTPEILPKTINFDGAFKWCPFIAPDESYLLISGYQDGGLGAGDIYVFFRNSDDTWSAPVNLGSTVNSNDNDRFPAISYNGKYLFFTSKRTHLKREFDRPQNHVELMTQYNNPGNGLTDIYWMDSALIDSLRLSYK